MEREQFTFYRSYYEALKKLSKRDREQAIMAICAYALDEEEIPLSGAAAVVFLLVKPTLDTGRKRASSGKQGGSKPKAKAKQSASEKEGEKEVEGEIENECYPPTPLSTSRKAPTFEQVEEYAKTRRSVIDPKPFFDYYSAAGWRDSEGKPVYNWQQKFVSWELREQEKLKRARKGSDGNVFMDMLLEEKAYGAK